MLCIQRTSTLGVCYVYSARQHWVCVQVQVRWLLGAEVVPASIAEVEFKADLQHNEFERQLVLDETNCGGSSVVTCKAEYTGGSRERQISVSVCECVREGGE